MCGRGENLVTSDLNNRTDIECLIEENNRIIELNFNI